MTGSGGLFQEYIQLVWMARQMRVSLDHRILPVERGNGLADTFSQPFKRNLWVATVKMEASNLPCDNVSPTVIRGPVVFDRLASGPFGKIVIRMP
ncbi:hypothetical protein SAMN05444161_1505 [Rhizobiales bacterium GAS191]|nr:hypothetical protein SAMN05444161_1505 [Rhizobiales bacterium GAS191]